MSTDLLMSGRLRRARAVAILTILACSTAAGQNQPPSQTSVIRVEGRVRGVGGDAIAGAVVVLEEAKGGQKPTSTTF